MPVFIDESGFYLLPAKVHTYAPRGQRPELRVYQTRAHLSLMCGLTPAGDLFSRIRPRSLTGLDAMRFLEHVHRRLQCRLLVIWDRIKIHRSHEVKDLVARMPDGLYHIEELPACAPELNPEESIWNLLKDVELKNVCCRDLPHLSHEISMAVRRLRRHRDLNLTCFEAAGLEL